MMLLFESSVNLGLLDKQGTPSDCAKIAELLTAGLEVRVPLGEPAIRVRNVSVEIEDNRAVNLWVVSSSPTRGANLLLENSRDRERPRGGISPGGKRRGQIRTESLTRPAEHRQRCDRAQKKNIFRSHRSSSARMCWSRH